MKLSILLQSKVIGRIFASLLLVFSQSAQADTGSGAPEKDLVMSSINRLPTGGREPNLVFEVRSSEASGILYLLQSLRGDIHHSPMLVKYFR
jgi:hypothetical protein